MRMFVPTSSRGAGSVLLLATVWLAFGSSGCKPSKRESYDVHLSVENVTLTSAAPQFVRAMRLSDDPVFAERKDQLEGIEDLSLRISVLRNNSSRVRIGVYVSKDLETRLIETIKIADFNLLANQPAPEDTVVRVFNEFGLRNLLLGDSLHLYLVAEGDRIDLTVAKAELIVEAKFVD